MWRPVKIDGLGRVGANISVVAPEAGPDIGTDPDVLWYRRKYRRGEVGSYRLAVAATNDPAVNAQVAADGDRAKVFVNSADDPANCSFTLPAVARSGDLQIAISTNGRSPALARWLRRRVETELIVGYDRVLDLLAEARASARSRFGTSEIEGWDSALDDGLIELARQGRLEQARACLRHHLGLVGVGPTVAPGAGL